MSNTEKLLNALVNGTSVDDFTPTSRVEKILFNCIQKNGVSNCEPPQSNNELLLQKLSIDLKTGSNVPVDVATAEEMTALLVSENVGKVYRYTGTTESTYTNGDLYEVVSE